MLRDQTEVSNTKVLDGKPAVSEGPDRLEQRHLTNPAPSRIVGFTLFKYRTDSMFQNMKEFITECNNFIAVVVIIRNRREKQSKSSFVVR